MLDRYKGGMEPSLGVAWAIARALDLPLDALVSDKYALARPAAASDTPADVVMLPLLDVVASAGDGAVNGHPQEIDRLPFSRILLRQLGVPPGTAHFLTVRGDSMHPTIPDGSIVLVNTAVRRPHNDGIYVVVLGDDVRIKRVQVGFDGAVTLMSDNAEIYKDERLAPADAERLRIAGRVFYKAGGL